MQSSILQLIFKISWIEHMFLFLLLWCDLKLLTSFVMNFGFLLMQLYWGSLFIKRSIRLSSRPKIVAIEEKTTENNCFAKKTNILWKLDLNACVRRKTTKLFALHRNTVLTTIFIIEKHWSFCTITKHWF